MTSKWTPYFDSGDPMAHIVDDDENTPKPKRFSYTASDDAQRHNAKDQSTMTMNELLRIAEDPQNGDSERRDAARQLGRMFHEKLSQGDAHDQQRARNNDARNLAEITMGAIVDDVTGYKTMVGEYIRRFAKAV